MVVLMGVFLLVVGEKGKCFVFLNSEVMIY